MVINLFSVWRGGGTFWNSANKIKKQFFSFQKALKIAPQVAQARKKEHRRASALLSNVRNIRICMGKKPIVSVTYGNEEDFNKTQLTLRKCVSRLVCMVHGPIYGRFSGALVRAKRAPWWVSKSTHPRKPGNHVTVHRPSVRTTDIPMKNNSINRNGNPNTTRGYFGGKSHSHPRHN